MKTGNTWWSDWAKPVYEHVPGAPFQVGMIVRVVDAIDRHVSDLSPLIGRLGVVRYLEYSCGCGQTFPHDPMIGVEFSDRSQQEFWTEELSLAKK